MYMKILVLVLAQAFLLKSNEAKFINGEYNKDEMPIELGEIEEDNDDSTKAADIKRAIGKTKKESFGEASMELATLRLLEEAAKKRKALENLKNEVNENSKDKCRKIKKVGEPIVHHHSGSTYGTWMRDPLGLLGPEKIWYINGHHGNKVLEFESMDYFKAGEVAKTYILPYNIDGTGSVVYGRYLYFNRANTKNIVQYDLVKETVTREKTPSGNVSPRKYYYHWGGYNTMDLSVDESGLWVLYGHSSYGGKLCATQLDPLTLGAIHTYCPVSTKAMKSMGNAFVACGIVYSIDSFSAVTTTVNYAYDTSTRTATTPGISFLNKFTYNSMVTYNPREKVLYSWNRNRQITYPLEFED
ncbi:noelin-like isoform X3 [Dendronephthya gigantea]|uniref:noelin-like isoform X2 n=1 Tax=Dendronephthya gigantea TaxID=151771 RepID=UPI001069036E|nr:noelin-like isoform X2 [Dendronephthya gigantea]XP_028397285.1 noelin-like isoform X3 [Dendronephthya gigantea]